MVGGLVGWLVWCSDDILGGLKRIAGVVACWGF